jgi:hypothetical protein
LCEGGNVLALGAVIATQARMPTITATIKQTSSTFSDSLRGIRLREQFHTFRR